ncbi:hypothetical protein Hrd1104_04930 [Halorhabdus sp. CBA1104]|uniref:hypothetical protein n=1 Tax=Halorhabdus sp. CBA1104 TaxID=1380432 RepID=UPI0012B39966|nr:hypothetical protein [Halorhabdus sp. CBA1104]QGN06701.1 hypothetical protein Hrd1104_04930 [Halorhabdus sp. CBA1104]
MTASSESAETDIARAIDRQIQTWLKAAPAQLVTDATRPIEEAADQFSGRYLVLAGQALPGTADREQLLSAAASVACLSAQMRLKANEAIEADSDDTTRAVLASDFLHSLAYAGVPTDDSPAQTRHATESIGQACYRSLTTASQRFTRCWFRSGANDSAQTAPIEPIVTAAAGELAGLLEEANDKRLDALRSLGLTLGLQRWRQRTSRTQSRHRAAESDPELPQGLPEALTQTEVQEALSMLPESSDRSVLERFVDSVLTIGHSNPSET